MNENLFEKTFIVIVGLLLATEIMSFLGQLYQPLNLVGFFIIIIAAAVVSFKKLEYGIYLILAELCIGGKGYLFSFGLNSSAISIRMALFLILFSVWTAIKIKNKKIGFTLNKKFLIPYSLLALTICYGIINGFLHNQTSSVIFDFNAWIFFALLFIFIDALNRPDTTRGAIRIIFAATSLLAVKTILTLVFFSHGLTELGDPFYKWIRDTGVGEITYISGTLFRVFFQSQLYVLIGLFIALTLVLQKKISRSKEDILLLIYIYLMSLTLIISQSRSFWIGAASAIIVLIGYLWWRSEKSFKKITILIIAIIATVASQILLIQVLTNNFSSNPISDRFRHLSTDAAGNSRLNQLEPLLYNISQQSIVGYGFGKELTYQSTDPRIVASNPGGIYTTYAFEWGYLDTVLKLGILGLLVYFFLVYTIIVSGLKNPSPTNIGLLTGLVAVLATNIFSPYLNHPLGIGYLLLLSAIFNQVSMLEKIKQFVHQSFAQSHYQKQNTHFKRTEYWFKKLNPNYDEAGQIAAYAHDIERAFRNKNSEETFKNIAFNNPEFLKHHAETGAGIISKFLEGKYEPTAITKINELIRLHEIGGTPEADLLKDADSISYLENNAALHLKMINKLGKEKVKGKIDWMYQRITSKKAREIARPQYEKIIKILEKI
ncbi:MAG: O-antigen ligase family protein [Candidatus Buchananbacteria bacterium]|nr:O-antigen ligase family protein [Candidatus Buchananbacteria bacterium]